MATWREALVFAAMSPPQPWSCHFCGGPVWFTLDRKDYKYRDTPVLHHKDHDHGNNDPSNWVWSHFGCHTSHHLSARHAQGKARGAAKKKK